MGAFASAAATVARRRRRRAIRARLAAHACLWPILSRKLAVARAKLSVLESERRRCVAAKEDWLKAQARARQAAYQEMVANAWEQAWHQAYSQGWQAAKAHAARQHEDELQRVATSLRDALPSAFFCPILGELMQDPVVTVADGHTYERSSISRWLSDHGTAPLTGLSLDGKHLVRNHALRNAIHDFLVRCASAAPDTHATAAWAMRELQRGEERRAVHNIHESFHRPTAASSEPPGPDQHEPEATRVEEAPEPAPWAEPPDIAEQLRLSDDSLEWFASAATLVGVAVYAIACGFLLSAACQIAAGVYAADTSSRCRRGHSVMCRQRAMAWASSVAPAALLLPLHTLGLYAVVRARRRGGVQQFCVATVTIGWLLGCGLGLVPLLVGPSTDLYGRTALMIWLHARSPILRRDHAP